MREFFARIKENLKLYKTEKVYSAVIFYILGFLVFAVAYVIALRYLEKWPTATQQVTQGSMASKQLSLGIALGIVTLYDKLGKLLAKGGPVLNDVHVLICAHPFFAYLNEYLFGYELYILIYSHTVYAFLPAVIVAIGYRLLIRKWAERNPESLLKWEEKHMPDIGKPDSRERYELRKKSTRVNNNDGTRTD